MKKQGETGGKQARKLLNSGVDPNVGKDTQFRPGKSGNPKGRPKGKSLSSQIQEMLSDEQFIERLNDLIPEEAKRADPEFQGTPMKAIITTAIIEAMDPTNHPLSRGRARDWIAKFGYGTKIDITSDGKRITETPKIISIINPRPSDATTEAEAS